jgi:hypothetical protein
MDIIMVRNSSNKDKDGITIRVNRLSMVLAVFYITLAKNCEVFSIKAIEILNENIELMKDYL